MKFARRNILWKLGGVILIFLAIAAFTARAATDGTQAASALTSAAGKENPAGPASPGEESLGVRCGWIVAGSAKPKGDRIEAYSGPCSGHVSGGMTQGGYVAFQ